MSLNQSMPKPKTEVTVDIVYEFRERTGAGDA